MGGPCPAEGNEPRECRRGPRGRRLPAGGHGDTPPRPSPRGRSFAPPGPGPRAPGIAGAALPGTAVPAWAPQGRQSDPSDRGEAEGASFPPSPSRPDSLFPREDAVRDDRALQPAPAPGSGRGSLRSILCNAQPGWVCLPVSTGVLSVWKELDGYTGIAQGSCPVLGLNSESISLRG